MFDVRFVEKVGKETCKRENIAGAVSIDDIGETGHASVVDVIKANGVTQNELGNLHKSENLFKRGIETKGFEGKIEVHQSVDEAVERDHNPLRFHLRNTQAPHNEQYASVVIYL